MPRIDRSGTGGPKSICLSSLSVLLVALLGPACARAEPIKVGVVRVAAFAPLYIAQERGYFAAEGVPAEIVTFDAAQPVAVGVAAGSIDFGVAALTAGLYNLAGQGALKIIAGAASETPGFHNQAYLVSTRAPSAASLKSLRDLPGHSVAVTGMGAPAVYVLGGLVTEKYGFDFKAIHLQPLQSLPNLVSSTVGGQSDATVLALTGSTASLIERGSLRLMGWVGDETPWQFGAAFTATKTANERRGTVEKFLRAYRKGARDYYSAFIGPDGKRQDGPTAPAIVAIIAKYTNQSLEEIKLSTPYIDADARLDTKDILRQVGWYKSQALVKPEVDGEGVMDGRYVVPLAER
jgi:NitT/TauT family transport system substrate-binding protein